MESFSFGWRREGAGSSGFTRISSARSLLAFANNFSDKTKTYEEIDEGDSFPLSIDTEH
jgi:hypothetical protein